MLKVKIIVGANYGDEGKGLATHYFSQQAATRGISCVNVLYNGGCQRGHTVELLDGTRHIFHHFGSGTFDGADTYFDRDFMVNPMEFCREFDELKSQGVVPACYISNACRVTTPFDMITNQIVEMSRDNRHGSCGMGIWETSQRYSAHDCSGLLWGEVRNLSRKNLRTWLNYIRLVWLPARLKSYGINDIPVEYKRILENRWLIENFISDIYRMNNHCAVTDNFYNECSSEYMIFEGAQGLALDWDNEKEYPHVTASKTGSGVPLLRCKNQEDIEICYITRSYFTRHGAGRFTWVCPADQINPLLIDYTNVENEWQGKIRYGVFDMDDLLDRVDKDFEDSKKEPKTTASLFVTHLNYTNGDVHGNGSIEELKGHFNKLYLSYDRFGQDVRILNKQ